MRWLAGCAVKYMLRFAGCAVKVQIVVSWGCAFSHRLTLYRSFHPGYSKWHPERPQFEWVEEDNITHDAITVESMQWVGRFLAAEIRKKYVKGRSVITDYIMLKKRKVCCNHHHISAIQSLLFIH